MGNNFVGRQNDHMTSPHMTAAADGASEQKAEIVHEGWLDKRGIISRRWKLMYFILWTDGTFLGYNKKPVGSHPSSTYKLIINRCRIKTCDKGKEGHTNKIHIKGMHWTSTSSRTFRAESEHSRMQWVQALERVAKEVTGKCNVLHSVDLVVTPARAKNDISVDSLTPAMSTAPTDLAERPLPAEVDHEVHAPPGRTSCHASIEDFVRLRLIGKGSFGTVELCREKETGSLFAMKMVKKEPINEDRDSSAQTEQQILSMIKHPFVTELHCWFDDTSSLYFVMDYACGGDFYERISRRTRLKSKEARFYAAQVVAAVGYLHSLGILYRDIKPENVLIAADGYVKLADFGLARLVGSTNGTATSACGTISYVAPEVLANEPYGRAVDWWSLGVLIFAMLAGYVPFDGPTFSEIKRKILTGNVVYPITLMPSAKLLLSSLLQKDPAKRLGSSSEDWIEVSKHRFFALMKWNLLLEKKIPPPFVPEVASDDDIRYFHDGPYEVTLDEGT